MISEKTRNKMSISAKKRCSTQWRKEISERLRIKINDEKLKKLYGEGYTQDECAVMLKVSRKVITNAMKRLSITSRKAIKRNQTGANNHMWKGDKATIGNKHRRLYRAFGQPDKCDKCGTQEQTKTYDWANLSGDYDNPADYMRMCRSCHSKYDKKIINIKK